MADREVVRFLARQMLEQAQSDTVDLEWSTLQERAAAGGLEVSREQLVEAGAEIMRAMAETGELDDEALDAIAGGGGQMVSIAFQNFDQKANQLYNLMSSIVKTVNDTRMATIRNML